jgi:hypothetical protein
LEWRVLVPYKYFNRESVMSQVYFYHKFCDRFCRRAVVLLKIPGRAAYHVLEMPATSHAPCPVFRR